MWADLFLIAVCIGVALYGARETVHTRHHQASIHKRRRTDF